MSEDSTLSTGGKHPYYRPTTADPRKRLFEGYEQTHSIRQAAAAAQVGSGTYSSWRKRVEADGYPGLERPRSHRPHTLGRQRPKAVRLKVLAAKREHPEWGRQRIADELRKAHGWQAVVSPCEVRRMLVEAGLWRPVTRAPQGAGRASATPQCPTRR